MSCFFLPLFIIMNTNQKDHVKTFFLQVREQKNYQKSFQLRILNELKIIAVAKSM